jgi:hypothetical protein
VPIAENFTAAVSRLNQDQSDVESIDSHAFGNSSDSDDINEP